MTKNISPISIPLIFILLIQVMTGFGQDEKKEEARTCAANDYECLFIQFTKAIEEDPKDFQSCFARGWIYRHWANYQNAISDLTKAIELKPNHEDALFSRSFCYRYLGKADLALEDLDELTRFNSERAAFHNNRGVVYYDLNDEKEAKRDFEKAVEILNIQIPLYSYDFDNYRIRGLAFANLDEMEKAIADYYQAIQLNPNDWLTYYHRGRLYLDQKNYSLALDEFNMAIKFEPEFARTYLFRAGLFDSIGNLAKSINDLKKYEELSTRVPTEKSRTTSGRK